MLSLQNRLAPGSALLLRLQEESGLGSSKSEAGQGVVGHCSGGACRLCRRAVRKFGIPEMQHNHGWKPSRGGDTPTREAKGCRAH